MSLLRGLKAYPTLLRIGFAEAVAYRAEFVVWMLTTTMPLVMLALWSAVVRSGGDFVGATMRFGHDEFVAYFLGALIVRTLTSSWVVWQMNQEIRMGTLSLRLLRPVSPFLAYSAEHLAAIPLRAAICVPVAVIMLLATGGGRIVADPVQLAILLPALAGAWLILFLAMLAIGTLGLFIERSVAVFEVWIGTFAVMSGYLVPLDLMPDWLRGAAEWLPFRYMLGFPVELLIGMSTRGQALTQLAWQWGWVLVFALIAALVWRAGLKRFEAYGA